MAAETYVQVTPDSTGKKIRNIQLDIPQSDGSIATVQMQVVNIRDESGWPVQTSDADMIRAIYQEIRALREMYGQATGMAFAATSGAADDYADIVH